MYEIDEAREEQEIQSKFEELLAACKHTKPLSKAEERDIVRAFSIAKKAHDGTRRKSGEPYIFHPLAVAMIAVEEVGLGPIAVEAALLHDVVEDTDITLEELRSVFGDRVASIVDGVTKIEDVIIMQQQSASKQAENYRKILLSMCNDAYVIFLKLCDRLHNMRTLDSMKDIKQLAISSETQYLYIPLAHRLGLYTIKTELEELVMKYTYPEKYKEISELIKKKRETEPKLKECITEDIRRMLDERGYKYTLKTRVKSVYSCWRKMQEKGVAFDEIYDLFAMRIILDVPLEHEKEECFKVFGFITEKFSFNPSRFRDWITQPKVNGYESLQFTVMTPIGQWVEIQLRSERMDYIAEKGIAAHFLYKEAHPNEKMESNAFEEWLQQIRSGLENPERSALDLVEEFTESLYTKEIYLFTPKGETIKLPNHSTVLDFAFAIHTDVGLHCIGAKVNAKVEPMSYLLHSGEQVQILTSRKTMPTDEWLNYAHTQRAKDHIKEWLREQKKEYWDKGEEKLKSICKKYQIRYNEPNLGRLRRYLVISTDVDLMYKVANGMVGEEEVGQCFGKIKAEPKLLFLDPYKELFDHDKPTSDTKRKHHATYADGSTAPTAIQLDNDIKNVEIETAQCCKPVQGDQVIGIAENGRITIHRTSCKKAMDEMANHENNIVRVRWRPGEKLAFLTGVTVTALDRKGLLQEMVQVITQNLDLNMRAITLEASEGVGRGIIMLYVNNIDVLNQLMDDLKKIEGVENVRRI